MCAIWVDFIEKACQELREKDFAHERPGMLGRGDAEVFFRDRITRFYNELYHPALVDCDQATTRTKSS